MGAWAMTIHKSQGMTINLLEADVSNCFEDGQAYVALSRATTLRRLKVIGFRKECVKVSKRVLKWYENLQTNPIPVASVFSEATNKTYPAHFDAEAAETASASVWKRCLDQGFQPTTNNSSNSPARKRTKTEPVDNASIQTIPSEARARMEAKRREAMRKLQAKRSRLQSQVDAP